jgi:arylformamidase
MNFIDLSLPISEKMPVWPGDPRPKIFRFEDLDRGDDWNTTRLEINVHDGTHVNFPIHANPNGQASDDFALENFCGESLIFRSVEDIIPGMGIFFRDQNITLDLAQKCVEIGVKFVGVSAQFDMNIEAERFLCKAGMLNFERIVHLEKCPKKFEFYGIPLLIENADGSPVRAFAKF